MKKIISLAVAVFLSLQLVACGDTKVIKGVEYDTYGLLNEDEKKNPDVQYEVCWGNVIWGVLLFQTVVGPVYFFGYSLFEPVESKPAIKGAVPQD